MTYTATFTATTSGTVEFSIRPDAVIDAGDRPNDGCLSDKGGYGGS